MNKTRVNLNIFVAITIIVTLLLCGIATFFVRSNNLSALVNTNSAVQIAGGAELYDLSTGEFNKNATTDLIDKLFGNNDPLQYVKSMKDTITDSYVIPASKINANVSNTNGVIVNLGFKKWIISSLTIADINGQEDIVMTLYLANPDGTTNFYNNSSSVKGNNAYARSIIRNHLLTDGNWSLYNQTGTDSFASKYLVQPKYIKYQHNQTCIGRGNYNVHCPNDALDIMIGNWHTSFGTAQPYAPSDTFDDINGVSQRYDAWGEDYIWIPSMAETGAADRFEKGTNSIWKLSASQVAFSGSAFTWLRSGDISNYTTTYGLGASGNVAGRLVTENAGGIRPAIHLNLTELIASAGTQLADPQDLTTSYNEKSQTIKSIATNSKADWYDADVYEHIDNYINITYPNNANGMLNSGEYWVKFEITQNYINAVNAGVDSEFANSGWSADYIQDIKDRRKPKFLGTPDTSSSSRLESDTVRWIKVTIDKAEIDFSKIVWSETELEYNGKNQSVTITNLPSYINLTYQGNTESAVGSYTAQVVDITTTNNNYKVPTTTELANYPKLKHSWKITKKKLTVSWKTEGKTQDGKTIYLPSLAFGSSMNVSVTYTYYKDVNLTQSITLKQIYDEFDLTKVKTYYVKAKLNSSGGDYNSTNSVLLEGGTEKAEVIRTMQTGSNANPVSVTLDKNKVTFNGKEQEAIFQITGTSLENIIISYFKADGTPLQKIPTNVGKYKVKVELKDTLTGYVLTGDTEFDFEIQSLRITKPPIPNQVQFYQIDGYGINDIVTLPSDWENYLIIKVIDKNNNEILPENGDWEFLNVGTYKIEISFKDNTNTSNGCVADNVIWSDSDKGKYFVTLEIMPLVLIVGDWQTSNGNKRPTMSGTDTTELEKYFDYMLYELKGDIIIGNALAQDTTLKGGTNYQISLKVKDIYKGNVLVEYKGIEVAETEPFKFKTSISGGIGGGDNNGNNGGGIDGNGGGDNSSLWLGTTSNGKLPLLIWILLASNLLTILLLVIVVIVVSRKKSSDRFDRVTPIANSVSDNNGINDFSDGNCANVNGRLITDKDWTFLVREQDILNIKALENQTERVIMYACKESDIKKAKKFHNTIADVGRKELDNILGEEDTPQANKKKKKKRKKR